MMRLLGMLSRKQRHGMGRPRRRKPTFRPRLGILEARLAPTVHTWIGGDSPFWSDPLNWANGSVPAANESSLVWLVFSAGLAGDGPTYIRNDITGLTVASIEFSETLFHPAGNAEESGFGYGYDLIGNSIVLGVGGGVSDQSYLLQRGPGLGGGIDRIDLPLVQYSSVAAGVISHTFEADFHDDLQILGQLSSTGPNALVKNGPGDLLLGNSTNNYLGPAVTVDKGSLEVSENAIPAASMVAVTVAAGATIYTDTNTFGSLSGAGTVTNTNGTNPTLTIGTDNTNMDFAGTITGALSLVKAGTGTLVLSGGTLVDSGPNSFTGTLTIQAGTLAMQGGLSFDVTLPPVAVTIDSGATLNLNGNGTEIGSLSGAGMVTNVPPEQPDYAEAWLIIGLDNTSTTFTGTITGQVRLDKVGTGAFTLGGVNDFSGHLTVGGGTLIEGVAGAIPDGLTGEVDAGATLLQNGYDVRFGSLSGAGTIDPIGGTLTTGSDNTSTTFSGIIAGGLSVVKVGSGTFTLSGANTYTGPTTVLAGTLQVTGSLSPSTIVTVAPGAVLTGTATLTNVTVNGTGSGDVFAIDTTGVTLNGVPIVTTPYVFLTIESVGNDDTFDVLGTNAGSTTTLGAGGGGNTFNVGSAANTLDPIQGSVIVTGSGSDSLSVYDQGTTTPQAYDIYANQVTREANNTPDMAPVSYTGVAHLVVHGGSAGPDLEVLGVVSTAPNTTTDIYNHGYEGEFIVEGLDGTLNGIQGPLHLHSNSAADYVQFDDYANTLGQTYTLTATSFSRSGMVPVTFSPMGQVILYAPQNTSPGSTVNVQAVAAGTFVQIALGSNDTMTVGSTAPALGGTLATILGPVRAFAPTPSTASVIVDDSGDTNPEQATLAPDANYVYALSNLTPGPIYLDQIGTATLDAGKGGNTFTVQGLPVNTALTINGGVGSNTLLGPNQATTWTLNGANNGTLGPIKFVHVQNLVGGSAGNVFQFKPNGSLSGSIQGGGGSNWLDYSAFSKSKPVSVNLESGAATAVAGGVANIANVRGGAGNDTLIGGGGNILVGSGGNDVLTDLYSGSSPLGGSLLIGGSGSDTLRGGSAGDILIGGTTIYDNENSNLQDILNEWDTAASHGAAFAVLQGTGAGATQSVLLWGTTVKDDGAVDVLTGALSPAEVDWFLAGQGDTANARQGIDYLNNGLA